VLLLPLILLEEPFELRSCVAHLVGRVRSAFASEQRVELRPRLGLAPRVLGGGVERRRVERKELAEVPALLVLDQVGLGLAAGVVAGRVVVAALAARVIVAPAALAGRLARDGLAHGDGRTAELALVGHRGRLSFRRAMVRRRGAEGQPRRVAWRHCPPAALALRFAAMVPRPDLEAPADRRGELARALKRYHARLARRLAALRGDLAEAERAGEFRAWGERLLAYLRQVPPPPAAVVLPDPSDATHNLTIELDPKASAQANAARYFKRAAKAERGLKQVPPRLAAAKAAAHELEVLLS